MYLFKTLLKFSLAAIVILTVSLFLASNTSVESIQKVDVFWDKLRWVMIIMVVALAGFAYFSWENIGRSIGRKYDYPDAVLLFKELKNTIFIAFAIMLFLGVML